MQPNMKNLQKSILAGLDLQQFKQNFENRRELWDLLTLYIDKLHALELLLVEEIACLTGTKVASSIQPPAQDLATIFGNPSDLRSHIESMSPDHVKSVLLKSLTTTNADDTMMRRLSSTGSELAKKGVSDLLAELSSAPASKEWYVFCQ